MTDKRAMGVPDADMDTLYRINDVLTALAAELNVRFSDYDDEDAVLNDLTFYVAERFWPEGL